MFKLKNIKKYSWIIHLQVIRLKIKIIEEYIWKVFQKDPWKICFDVSKRYKINIFFEICFVRFKLVETKRTIDRIF
jgi:hypothetical protein